MAWKPDYITSAQLKNELKITDSTDDVWVGFVVTAASRAVDRHTRRQFGLLAEPLELERGASYRAERGRWVVAIPDLMTVTGLAIDVAGDAVTTDYKLEPGDAALEGKPWTRLVLPFGASYSWADDVPTVAVTARWGWSAVPGTVATATLLQAQRFYARRDSPFGVAGSPDLGSELRLLSKVDADVAVMLADYWRPAAAA